MNNQKATGNIVVDSISTLDMTMSSDSYYEGTINEVIAILISMGINYM